MISGDAEGALETYLSSAAPLLPASVTRGPRLLIATAATMRTAKRRSAYSTMLAPRTFVNFFIVVLLGCSSMAGACAGAVGLSLRRPTHLPVIVARYVVLLATCHRPEPW